MFHKTLTALVATSLIAVSTAVAVPDEWATLPFNVDREDSANFRAEAAAATSLTYSSSSGTLGVLDAIDFADSAECERFGIHKCEQVTNTAAYPFRVIGRLSNGATGVLVGPRHVLTAGHAVYDKNTDRYHDAGRISFSPARNGSNFPFGSFEAQSLYAAKGWTQNHDLQHDYGMVILKERIGDRLGWMGFGYHDNVVSFKLNVVGYPSDRPMGTAWRSFGPIESANDRTIYHKLDIWYGNSGGPLYRYVEDQGTRIIYGIQSWHRLSGNKVNGAKRIDREAYQTILGWIQSNPGGLPAPADLGDNPGVGPGSGSQPDVGSLAGGRWRTSPGDETFVISATGTKNQYSFRYKGVFIEGSGILVLGQNREITMRVQAASGGTIFGKPIPVGVYEGTVSHSQRFTVDGVPLDNRIRTITFTAR